MRFAALLLSATVLLTACAITPSAPQVTQTCPLPPPLMMDIPEDVLEHSFIDRIQSFLSGRLPEPISYDLHSKPVKMPMLKSEQ